MWLNENSVANDKSVVLRSIQHSQIGNVPLPTCIIIIIIFLNKIYYEEDNQLTKSYSEQFLSQYYAMTSKHFYNFQDM